MTDRTQGMTAAMDGAEIGEPPVERAEQLPLLPSDQVAKLPTDRAARREALRAPRSGPGRPPGARNKSTAAWRDYLLGRYPSPLVALAEAYTRPARDLAEELGCKPVEAFQVQMRAAAELAPYLHGKMPVEVQVSGALPVIHMMAPEDAVRLYAQTGTGDGVEGGIGTLMDLTPVVNEMQQNQWVDGGRSGHSERPDLEDAQKA